MRFSRRQRRSKVGGAVEAAILRALTTFWLVRTLGRWWRGTRPKRRRRLIPRRTF
jgi:hypothetical protein